MKYTIKDIESKVAELWSDADGVEVTSPRDGIIHIRLEAMYQAPGSSLKDLVELSNFLGTTDIEEYDRFNTGGCESCDWGSSYGVTLEVTLPKE